MATTLLALQTKALSLVTLKRLHVCNLFVLYNARSLLMKRVLLMTRASRPNLFASVRAFALISWNVKRCPPDSAHLTCTLFHIALKPVSEYGLPCLVQNRYNPRIGRFNAFALVTTSTSPSVHSKSCLEPDQ